MNTYRSLNTIQAVQFTGDPIHGVTCGGSESEVFANGCDSSRKQHIHVHANVTGGMVVLQPGDWIFPVSGGPWGVASNAKFCGAWEVPDVKPATIEGLEAILNGPEPIVYVQKDGSVSTVPDTAETADVQPSAESVHGVWRQDKTAEISQDKPAEISNVPVPVGVESEVVPVVDADGNSDSSLHVQKNSDGTIYTSEIPATDDVFTPVQPNSTEAPPAA